MTNNPVSPIEAVNAAIQSHNPFINAGINTEPDVWQKRFDVTTLNAHASNIVFQALDLVRNSQSSQDKVTSIAITAARGVGKTHLLSRIRHRLELEGGALFIYSGVNNYTDLNLVKYQFQQTLADSLSKTGSQGVMQWQEVAAAIANEGFKAINPNATSLSPQELVNKFDKVDASFSANNKNLMDKLITPVLKTKPNADPYILRAILWTLSENKSPFAIKWLSGDELANSDAEALGLPNPSKSNQDKEAEALKNIQQILNLVSYYNPVVICFDEIDVKINCNDDGLPTEIVIANLVKILHDTLENYELGRGVVIITVMLPEIWTHKINVMPGGSGTPHRVSKYTGNKPIELRYIDSNSLVELVTIWLKDFYNARNLTPPDLLYPFKINDLQDFGKGKPTIREALRWCAENFKVEGEILPPDPLERFKLALKREYEPDIDNYLDDNSLIANALLFSFQTLKGETLEGETSTGEKLNGLTIQEIEELSQKSPNNGFINFKIIVIENEKIIKIGVAVAQPGKSILSALNRLTDYSKFDISRGCLLRSKSKRIDKKGEAYKLLEHLVSNLGGEWVDLKPEEVKTLIDIYYVYQKRNNYQLSEEQVIDFSRKITREHPLLLEILSDPAGQIDEEAIAGEELLNSFLNPFITDETDDSDALLELFN
ncbi:P-loop NTPase fold protein [Aliinostoc sp. HNIBRCY26]|uniref:P-loop NTPase fold protein n=1 Tax=Aliinostoc sp. HNIBRCY26 TaxID=3418997 RepID=UPI003CFE0CEE